VTTAWTRVTKTITIPSISGKTLGTGNCLEVFLYSFSDTIPVSGTIDIWGVQIEYGSLATPFQTASGGSPQAELAMCQRYYYRWVTGGTSTAWAGTGMNYSTTNALVMVKMPVSMRVNVTAIDVTSTASNYRVLGPAGVGAVTCTSVPALDTSHNESPLLSFATGASLVLGQGNAGGANSTNSAYIGFSAEL
jgi:hypothetical protein